MSEHQAVTAYRKNLLAWALFLGVGLALIFIAVYISNWFVVPLVGLALGAHLVFDRIRCPRCNTPLTYEGETRREGPFATLGIPSAFFRKSCANCGWDLRELP